MTKKKPNIDRIEKNNWIRLPSGAIVSIRDIQTVITETVVVTVRTLNSDGAMSNGSFEMSMEYLRNKGELVPTGMVPG